MLDAREAFHELEGRQYANAADFSAAVRAVHARHFASITPPIPVDTLHDIGNLNGWVFRRPDGSYYVFVHNYGREEPEETRATYVARLIQCPPSQRLLAELAYTLTKYHHRAQIRKERDRLGRPIRYFNHPRRCSIRAIDKLGLAPDHIEIPITVMLHDVIEDSPTGSGMSAEMIEHCFGTDITHMLLLLSKVDKELYTRNIQRTRDWRVLVSKGLDRHDNQETLWALDYPKQCEQVTETRTLYYPLFERMVELTPPEYRDGVQELRDDIVTLTDRYATALGI